MPIKKIFFGFVFDKNIDNNNIYCFNKKCQSDSYTSHLVSLCCEENENLKTTFDGNLLPKSASVVRFKKQLDVTDLELTSDYCSIETVNKVSVSSNYSQSPGEIHRRDNLINDYPELKFGKSTDSSVKLGKSSGFGFSNPHYMGPDVQTILKSKEGQKCAKMLNSPPDSVLEDTSGKILTNNSHKENVEMQNIGKKMATNGKLPTPPHHKPRSPPKYLPLNGNPYNTTTIPITNDKKKKFRTNSTGRQFDKQDLLNSYLQKNINDEFSKNDPVTASGPPLTVFLIGGKEHGQVTAFKRPISLWKLRLSSNVY